MRRPWTTSIRRSRRIAQTMAIVKGSWRRLTVPWWVGSRRKVMTMMRRVAGTIDGVLARIDGLAPSMKTTCGATLGAGRWRIPMVGRTGRRTAIGRGGTPTHVFLSMVVVVMERPVWGQ